LGTISGKILKNLLAGGLNRGFLRLIYFINKGFIVIFPGFLDKKFKGLFGGEDILDFKDEI